jgi:signal peptidase I
MSIPEGPQTPWQPTAPTVPAPAQLPLPPPAAPTPKRTRSRDTIIEVATTVVLAVVLYVVIQTFVVQTYRVEQHSMEPTLVGDQHLLIDKLTPRFDDYSRGDIIVFHAPGTPSDSTPYIKRVIGVGGDHLALKDGAVYVNGAKLEEPYTSPDGPTRPLTKQTTWDVPVGSLFVMGDHRTQSEDSREFGIVPLESVIGRAWLRFWPANTLTILHTPTYPNVPSAPPASTSSVSPAP